MKLWEILKSENVGKYYQDDNSQKYKIVNSKSGVNLEKLDGELVSKIIFEPSQVMQIEFEEIFPKTGWEIVGKGNEYFVIGQNNNVMPIGWENDSFDKKQYFVCNAFSLLRKAKEEAKKDELRRKMQRFYDVNDSKINSNKKYKIVYNFLTKEPEIEAVYNSTTIGINEIYFSDLEVVTACLKKIVEPYYELWGGYINENRS